MTSPVIKHLVRTMLWSTSRMRASNQARAVMKDYLALGEGVSPDQGARPVRVPPMRGVDEDMRAWSYFMILGHNALVNRSITAMVTQLARRERLSGAALINPKKGVMPPVDSGPEKMQEFQASVTGHLDAVASLGNLRGTDTSIHPVFGEFDAHRWHAMFAFHLKLHLKQAAYVVEHSRKKARSAEG